MDDNITFAVVFASGALTVLGYFFAARSINDIDNKWNKPMSSEGFRQWYRHDDKMSQRDDKSN
jgi:hypothetical protein